MILYNLILLIITATAGQLIAHYVLNKLFKSEDVKDLIAYAISSIAAFLLSLIPGIGAVMFLEIISLAFLAVLITEYIKQKVSKRKTIA
ncbi:hypothetical protein [Jeotgalibacillus terrae]|uniref:Uncharacterized protein n=1 Tax=Jeotgalibacillus terrae TaxID=587735 RepID=A0ABW5ZIW2_9BACL|nr:hypothetical protein [Jeotgalibacillus terrae]MBM7578641.1 hypothetical protein [Jeotgalibacillus terrae]